MIMIRGLVLTKLKD